MKTPKSEEAKEMHVMLSLLCSMRLPGERACMGQHFRGASGRLIPRAPGTERACSFCRLKNCSMNRLLHKSLLQRKSHWVLAGTGYVLSFLRPLLCILDPKQEC